MNYRLIIVAVSILLTLQSCGSKNEVSDIPPPEYKIDTAKFENINPEKDIEIVIEYPQLSQLEDISIEDKVNEIIKGAALEPYYYYLERDGDFDNTSWPVEYTIVYDTGNILSVMFEGYVYTKGSAHGTNWVYTVNINMNTGERITIDELFNESFKEKITLDVFYLEIQDDSRDFIEEIMITHKDDFIDSHDNFYFGVEKFYIILPIMSGRHSFEASYDDLKDCINWDNPIWSEILEVK